MVRQQQVITYTREHVLSVALLLTVLHGLSMFVDLPSATFARGRGRFAKNQNGSARPLRQEPEWQLNDLDVQEAWREIDEDALDRCSPATMLALAQDVVDTLGRWPVVFASCSCPQERRLEVRLALIFNAYVAKPYSTHPRMKFFEVIACKTKLRALWEMSMSATSAAQPDLSDIASWTWILQALGLHMRPVDGRDVFFHTPAKSMLQERSQEAVLRKFGVYEPLELCYQASKPWGRFFIFDRDFVSYNRAGMQAEDPNAHK